MQITSCWRAHASSTYYELGFFLPIYDVVEADYDEVSPSCKFSYAMASYNFVLL